MQKVMLGKSSTTAARKPEAAVQPAEKARLMEELEKAENAIQGGMKVFIEIGRELRRIRDGQLYKGADDATFEDYVQRRWQMTRTHAYRFIQAAECFENVTKLETSVLPASESQVRPMASLPSEKQQEVWTEAVKISEGDQPTAKQVSAAVAKVTGKVKAHQKKPVRVKDQAVEDIVRELQKEGLIIRDDDGLKANVCIDTLMWTLTWKVEQQLFDSEAGHEDADRLLEKMRTHGEYLLEMVERSVRLRCSNAKTEASAA